MCVFTKYFSKLFNRNLVFRKSILPKCANFCSSTIFCTVTKLLRYYQYNHVHLQVNSKLLFTSLNTIAYIRSYFVKKQALNCNKQAATMKCIELPHFSTVGGGGEKAFSLGKQILQGVFYHKRSCLNYIYDFQLQIPTWDQLQKCLTPNAGIETPNFIRYF